jgi:Flp pilus assembly protein TadB
VSKERAQRRALREQATAQRQLAERANRERAAIRARRSARLRRLFGRRSSRPNDPRRKERRATIGSVLLVAVVVSYLATRSVLITIGVLLIAAIVVPALVITLFDRSRG